MDNLIDFGAVLGTVLIGAAFVFIIITMFQVIGRPTVLVILLVACLGCLIWRLAYPH